MILSEWHKSEELIKAWRQTWREPHMQMGLDLLRSSVCETGFRVSGETDALTAGALRDAAREGFKAALFLMEIMKEGKTPAPQQPTSSLTLVPEFDNESLSTAPPTPARTTATKATNKT